MKHRSIGTCSIFILFAVLYLPGLQINIFSLENRRIVAKSGLSNEQEMKEQFLYLREKQSVHIYVYNATVLLIRKTCDRHRVEKEMFRL